jgi:excisionase family DNA binding protein
MNKTNSNHLELLTKQGVARLLTVCPRTVENLMAARRLAYIRIGRAVRFERSEIERFKASLTVQAVG